MTETEQALEELIEKEDHAEREDADTQLKAKEKEADKTRAEDIRKKGNGKTGRNKKEERRRGEWW